MTDRKRKAQLQLQTLINCGKIKARFGHEYLRGEKERMGGWPQDHQVQSQVRS